MVYAKFGGQTGCIMGNWKIENTTFVCLKVRQYQQQVEMMLAVPININSLLRHNLTPGMASRSQLSG